MQKLAAIALLASLAGCAGQILSDERARASIAGNLGVAPGDVSIVSHVADGPTDTNFLVEARWIAGRRVCVINGGNILTMGMTNGAYCHRPGES